MEAANLGTYAAPSDDAMLDGALELLAAAPPFTPSVRDWARAAFGVRERWPGGGDSVGIPTWFYAAGTVQEIFDNAKGPVPRRTVRAPRTSSVSGATP